MKSSFEDTPEKSFWKYFLLNSKLLFDDKKCHKEIPHLLKELKLIHPDLTFEIGSIVNNKREFIISANGIKEAFPYVLKLVKAAPLHEKWEIIAFRPRKGIDLSVSLNGIILDTTNIFFNCKADKKNKIDLEIYIEKSDIRDIRLHYSVYILLDSLIGEYDVETKIGIIDIKKLTNSIERKKLMPLSKLPEIVDLFTKSKVN